jgi:DNA-binding transcriptional MerR regulator
MEPAGLPPIPAKRYFTIGEVSELCAVKPYVLRYWEQEFSQLRPMKRRGNRRYYQHHEVLLVRRIRELLYEEGFTISGARNRLVELAAPGPGAARGGRPALSAAARAAVAAGPAAGRADPSGPTAPQVTGPAVAATPASASPGPELLPAWPERPDVEELRGELLRIRALLEI